MRGIHTFRRDRTTHIIWCNPWSARFHPYSTLVKKMRTYLHLEGKLGPKCRHKTQVQPSTSAPAQPIANTAQRKEKRKTKILAKRRYKVRLVAQPAHTTITSAPDTKVTMAPATLKLRATYSCDSHKHYFHADYVHDSNNYRDNPYNSTQFGKMKV